MNRTTNALRRREATELRRKRMAWACLDNGKKWHPDGFWYVPDHSLENVLRNVEWLIRVLSSGEMKAAEPRLAYSA